MPHYAWENSPPSTRVLQCLLAATAPDNKKPAKLVGMRVVILLDTV